MSVQFERNTQSPNPSQKGAIIKLLFLIAVLAIATSKVATKIDETEPPKKEEKPIYIDRIFSDDSKRIYNVMKQNGLLADKDGTDRAKMAAMLVAGYVSRDDDPCFDGKNPKKCIQFIKEAVASEKYKTELESYMARVKPLPVLTEKERRANAWEQGSGTCDELARKVATIPSSVDFSHGGRFDAMDDGTYVKVGSFTHKNGFGQQLKKKFECRITLSKNGYDVTNVKILKIYESD
jgi:hypothetical protein